MYEGYSSLSISWTATDLYPATYTVEIIEPGPEIVPTALVNATVWTSGNPITCPIPDGLSAGTYEITITVSDESGYTARDTVSITVSLRTFSSSPGFPLLAVFSASIFLLSRRRNL